MTAFLCSKHHPIFFSEKVEIYKFLKQERSMGAWRLSVRCLIDVKIVPVVSQEYGEKTPTSQRAKHKQRNSTVPKERDPGLKNWHNEIQSTEKWLAQLL